MGPFWYLTNFFYFFISDGLLFHFFCLFFSLFMQWQRLQAVIAKKRLLLILLASACDVHVVAPYTPIARFAPLRCIACSTGRMSASAPEIGASLQIARVNEILLTRIEHNCPIGLAGCTDVIIYNHGFPDSSVVPTADQDLAAAVSADEGLPENAYFSSRFPRKLCEYVIKNLENIAFVAFNTRGVPGSSKSAPDKIETAPPEFENKSLTGEK